ncbi:MAG: hypothetical protein P9L92_18270 [Candidatus Electryonea clarkiae]|nr:hypothetical protein [Candidatus Electryonea clarkiae]MDP8288477.1 hypothetical protein [Candidatus Electryonea clarkiae]
MSVPRLSEHRDQVEIALKSINNTQIWRDISQVKTPWGKVTRSNAIYRYEKDRWYQIVDEFGEPTAIGWEIYNSFMPPRPPTTLVRISNRNQMKIEQSAIRQMSPLSWTTAFLELSTLYDLLRDIPNRRSILTEHIPQHGILEQYLGAINEHDKRIEIAKKFEELAIQLEGLPLSLQALLLILDSDLGCPSPDIS